jgi:hypothetical protein
MENLHDLIKGIPNTQWDYYTGIDNANGISNPFDVLIFEHKSFIESYFKRGGKIEVLRSTGIITDKLRLPNHINSVFFLGVLFYYRTNFHQDYKIENNDPGYSTFPFIWFLIALFHDNAYQMEDDKKLSVIATIEDLYTHFKINHLLLDVDVASNCGDLMEARKNYFTYRKNIWKVVDHGILGGILLYDRLVKIRRRKKRQHEDDLFWGKNLEAQYLLAANAISLHNIWLPQKGSESIYEQYGLGKLLSFTKIKFADFPLFYILGIVDTIEPLKTFKDDGFTDHYILENLYFEFSAGGVVVSYNEASNLDFCKLKEKTKYFKDWLDIEVKTFKDRFELVFR